MVLKDIFRDNHEEHEMGVRVDYGSVVPEEFQRKKVDGKVLVYTQDFVVEGDPINGDIEVRIGGNKT